jgi:hypothetical protein
MEQIPLNYEASAGDSHKQAVTSLPNDVVQCLENARFVSRPDSAPSRPIPLTNVLPVACGE